MPRRGRRGAGRNTGFAIWGLPFNRLEHGGINHVYTDPGGRRRTFNFWRPILAAYGT
jgi:hypothetical protein